MTEIQSIHHAGCKRHHVLERAAELNAQHIVVGVHPKGRCHQRSLECLDQSLVAPGQTEHRRPPCADFCREARTRQHHKILVHGRRKDIGHHLSHQIQRIFFNSLRRADERDWRGKGSDQFAQHRTRNVRRHHKEQPLAPLGEIYQRSGRHERRGKRDTRQKNRILVFPVDRIHNLSFIGPEPSVETFLRQMLRQSRAPSAGPDHSYAMDGWHGYKYF